MNTEAEEIKDKIRGFLNKQNLEIQTQYFLILSLSEDFRDEILDDDEDDEELGDDGFNLNESEEQGELEEPEEDSVETLKDELETEELEEKQTIKQKQPKKDEIIDIPPLEQKQDHKIGIKKLLSKSTQKKAEVQIDKNIDFE